MSNRLNKHSLSKRTRSAYKRDDAHGRKIQKLLDELKGQREAGEKADQTQDGNHIGSKGEGKTTSSPATTNSYMLVFERNTMQTGNEGQGKSQIPEAVRRSHRTEIL